MKFQLAKKLKRQGFPQRGTSTETVNDFNDLLLRGRDNNEATIEAETCYVPTEKELLMAVLSIPVHIKTNIHEEYAGEGEPQVKLYDVESDSPLISIQGRETMREALAELWLGVMKAKRDDENRANRRERAYTEYRLPSAFGDRMQVISPDARSYYHSLGDTFRIDDGQAIEEEVSDGISLINQDHPFADSPVSDELGELHRVIDDLLAD